MKSIKIKNREILLDDIKEFTKIKNGIYSIVENDGTTIKSFMLKMDVAEAAMKIISERDNQSQSALKVSDTPQKSAKSEVWDEGKSMETSIEAIEKNFGSHLNVTFKDPNLTGYWETDSGIPKRLAIGYEFTKPSDLLNFESQFADLTMGFEKNPDSMIKRGELTLMHTSKKNKENIMNYHYKQRRIHEVQSEYGVS